MNKKSELRKDPQPFGGKIRKGNLRGPTFWLKALFLKGKKWKA